MTVGAEVKKAEEDERRTRNFRRIFKSISRTSVSSVYYKNNNRTMARCESSLRDFEPYICFHAKPQMDHG